MNPLDIEAIRAEMRESLARKQYAGAYACALSLVDIALWDIKGKVTGQPIWRLLGGARGTVPAYITFGLPQYSMEQLVEVARSLVADGQKRLKIVVGAPAEQYHRSFHDGLDNQARLDASRIQAVREAVGPDVELMVDANKHLTYPQALRLARLLEPYDLTWFEDAVLYGDPEILAELRNVTTVPMAAGSTGTSNLFNLRQYLTHRAVDYLQPNVRDIGGFTGGLKAAALAEAFNVSIQMGGNWPHINMHLHAGVPNGGRVEFHLQGWQVGTILFDGMPNPDHGMATLPEGPGLGLELKPGVREEFTVE